MTWIPESELWLTGLVTLASLAAVWLPFSRGARLCRIANVATQRLSRSELREAVKRAPGRGIEPLAVLMAQVLGRSLRDRERAGTPSDFVLDASRQFAVNEYDAHYARPISMYAGILPPIGFIGTTAGLLILFISMHLANGGLELGALALALSSSILALAAFATLEGMKIRLYGRLLLCLGDVVALQRGAEQRHEAADRAA